MWILVLRNTETGKSHIWQSKKLFTVTRAFKTFLARNRAKNLGLWTEEAEEYLWKHYRELPIEELVTTISRLLCRTVTKSAVIGYHHRMKISRGKHDLLPRETGEPLRGLDTQGR